MRLAFKSKPYFLFVPKTKTKPNQCWDGRKLTTKFENRKSYKTKRDAAKARTAIQKNAFLPGSIKQLKIGMVINNKNQEFITPLLTAEKKGVKK
jgi:hypothetical protein